MFFVISFEIFLKHKIYFQKAQKCQNLWRGAIYGHIIFMEPMYIFKFSTQNLCYFCKQKNHFFKLKFYGK